MMFGAICFNPCCNGRYSQSKAALIGKSIEIVVLILVVMEDTLRDTPESIGISNAVMS